MTSLEGLPAKETTEENLQLWAKGEKAFADFYLPALQNYELETNPSKAKDYSALGNYQVSNYQERPHVYADSNDITQPE